MYIDTITPLTISGAESVACIAYSPDGGAEIVTVV